jgi:hypothetical protein
MAAPSHEATTRSDASLAGVPERPVGAALRVAPDAGTA